MQRVAVLIDFTDGSVIAFKQAEQLAAKAKSEIHAVHITDSNDKMEAAGSHLRGFVAAHSAAPHEVKTHVGVGNVQQTAPAMMKKISPDVVVVCTHGIKGIAQHLFGAKILQIARVMRYPMIILHENNRVNIAEVDSILFPLGPHPEFATKIRQTGVLAQALGASVVLYEIETPGSAPDADLEKNKNIATLQFNEMRVNSKYVFDEMKFVSAGYSRQTLAYATENHFGLISVMASVSQNQIRFAAGDKENLVINDEGVPVLVCAE